MSKPNMLETALLSQWGRCLDEAEVIYDRKTAEVFEAAKRGLLKRFLDEAGAAADIGGCDERLYACCGRVTDCCRRAVAIYEANKSWLVSDGIGAVLAEAASALASRIRLFDESRDRESNYENPVVSEKKSILGTGAAYFVHEAQSAEERFKEQTKAERAKAGRPAARRPDGERSNAAWQNEERSNAAWQNEERSRPFPTSALGLPSGGNVDDFILQGAAESLREAYDKSLAITAGRLADLSAHGKTAFYMDLLESERDALVAVVNAQVPAMLGELEGDAATSHEKTIILGVLSVIREAYRYLAGEAAKTPEAAGSESANKAVRQDAGYPADEAAETPEAAGNASAKEAVRQDAGYPAGEAAETPEATGSASAKEAVRQDADTGGPGRRSGTEKDAAEWLEILRSFMPERGAGGGERPAACAGFAAAMEKALPMVLARAIGESYPGRPAFEARKLRDEAIGLAEDIQAAFAAFGGSGGEYGGQADGRAGEQANGRADGQAGKRADGQTGAQADGRPGGQADGRPGGQANGQACGQANGQAGGLAERQASGQANEQTGGQAGGQAGEIVRGILETLAIKADSLGENIQAFAVEFDGIIPKNAPAGEPFEIKEDEAREMLGEALEAWAGTFARIPCRDREIKLLFDEFIAGCRETNGFSRYIDRLAKNGERALAQAEKAAARFLKDFVLYEVSTFEEIINYSVSRLYESDDRAILAFAEKVSAAADGIYALLARGGIEIIAPRPHDAFNGKEHEVLVAEESPDFAKGEVIKRVSLGYRRNGAVLLRANVIAAK